MAKQTLAGITAGVNDGPAGVLAAWNAMVVSLNAMFTELYAFMPLHATVTRDWGTINAGVTATFEVTTGDMASVEDGAGVFLGWASEGLPHGIVAQAYTEASTSVFVALSNVTAGNIAVGTRTCHVFAVNPPAA